jgi:hypothetical protein
VGGRINFNRKPTTPVRGRRIQNNGLATAENYILYANRGSHVGYWGELFSEEGTLHSHSPRPSTTYRSAILYLNHAVYYTLHRAIIGMAQSV